MTGRADNPPKNLLACDLCYKRKVKCDRQEPCRNCVTTKAACLWTRQTRVRRRRPKTADTLVALTERMHHLEDLLQHSERSTPRLPSEQHIQASSAHDDSSDMEVESAEDVNSRASSSRMMQRDTQFQSVDGRPEAGHASDTSQLDLVSKQIDALNKALEAEKDFSRDEVSVNWIGEESDTCELTSTDIVNTITATTPCPTPSALDLASLILPRFSIKTMCEELLGNKISYEKRLQYQVIVNFNLALSLGRQQQQQQQQQQNERNNFLNDHVRRIQKQRFRAILASLSKIGFLATPCLSLLQAQCIGVMVLQYLGNVHGAWNMMVAVSRTFVALGYDTITKTLQDEEVMNCLTWCYHFDRSLSFFLGRPRLLPGTWTLPVPPYKESDLSRNTWDQIVFLESWVITKFLDDILDIAREKTVKESSLQVTGGMPSLDISLARGEKESILREFGEEIEDINRDFMDTFSKYEISKLLKDAEPELHRRNTILGCKSSAILTLVWQAHPYVRRRIRGEAILKRMINIARDTLTSLINSAMQIGAHDCATEVMPWNILCYGITPMWLLSCNTIRELEESDFELLKEYADLVLELQLDNPLAKRVHKLCETLIELCEPLILQKTALSRESLSQSQSQSQSRSRSLPTNHDPRRKNFLNFDAFFTQDESSQSPSQPQLQLQSQSQSQAQTHALKKFIMSTDIEKLNEMLPNALAIRPAIYVPNQQTSPTHKS